MDLNKIILAIVVFLNLSLSFFVIGQNWRLLTNRFFSLLSFIASLWAFANYMTGVNPIPFWLESTYALGAILVAIGLIWVLVITNKVFNKKISLLIILVALAFSIGSYTPGFIASRYDQIYLGGVFTGTPGWGLIVYTVFYLIGAFLILWKLHKTHKVTLEKNRRVQLKSIFFGALITLVITALTSFILPSLSIFSFSGLDSIGFLFFLTFIAFAITKQHLFNIKVIATELITFALWIIILVRTLIADNTNDMFIEGSLLIITIAVGILLIRSVIKEVQSREKIQLLATDLEKANDRLTELDRQKSEFVSFATHQLRAPLTAMKGYASLILEGDLGETSKEACEAVGRIFESTNTLTSIVDDYLNITRIELGTMKYAFETLNMKTLVEDVIAELKPNIDKAVNVKFSFNAENSGMDYRITADRDKLKQVIANLIDNSFKYTPKGTIDARLSFDRPRHKFVFTLKDTGIGISSEVLPLLFNKFSRAGNANKTNIKGTGLGLFVAKQMITAQHGTIRAESEGEGKGSTFIVEIDPFAKV
ncbi:MAG: ATP-binding protein [Patescibacteria group bacterium]